MMYVNQFCRLLRLGPSEKGNRMLIGLPNALTPDLLRHLKAMGHGDELVIADANFRVRTRCFRIEKLNLTGRFASDLLRRHGKLKVLSLVSAANNKKRGHAQSGGLGNRS